MSPRLSLRQAGGLKAWAKQPDVLWEVALAVGGLTIIGLTFSFYPRFNATQPLSRLKLSPGEADRQIEAAKSFIADHPEDINAHIALAMAYYQKGPEGYVDALNALDKARALGATSERLFYYAGVMYQHLGLLDYAANEYSKYLRHHPKDYETMIRLANVHFQQKHLDQAETLYKEAIASWPKDATAWFNYAIVHKERGRYDEALRCLKEAEAIGGQLPVGGLYQMGEIHRLMGDNDQASAFFQKELDHESEYIPALEGLDGLFRAKGDFKSSREIRKRISEIKKKNSLVKS